MEERTALKAFKVERRCEHCEKGIYRHTGECLLVYPPVYPHICTDCNHRKSFKKIYPSIEYGE